MIAGPCHIATVLRALWRVAIAAVLAAMPGLAAADYRDSDWTHGFYANCALPVPGTESAQASAGWLGAEDPALRIRLAPGQVGGCRSDSRRRNGAPYWERAELRQYGELPRDMRHRIDFVAYLLEGFTGQEETFFQIHGWKSGCNSAPLAMLQFDKGALGVKVLQRQSDPFKGGTARGGKGALADQPMPRGLRSSLQASAMPQRFTVLLDLAARNPRISIELNGLVLVDGAPLFMQRCAAPHMKMGIYRPGRRSNHVSMIAFDDVIVSSSR